jgi:hypothetical protein
VLEVSHCRVTRLPLVAKVNLVAARQIGNEVLALTTHVKNLRSCLLLVGNNLLFQLQQVESGK